MKLLLSLCRKNNLSQTRRMLLLWLQVVSGVVGFDSLPVFNVVLRRGAILRKPIDLNYCVFSCS